MDTNKALIEKFYTSFRDKNFKGMQECYDDDAVFSDEVFKGLDAIQVKAMWEMLLVRGKDLDLTFKNVAANEIKGSAEWTATYTFTRTGRKVINHIKANFIFNNGKIIQHVDRFDFYAWARQALGLSGLLLGWTDYLKKKVQKSAKRSLEEYMSAKDSL
jgi:ketosteroid isomerase-like protein